MWKWAQRLLEMDKELAGGTPEPDVVEIAEEPASPVEFSLEDVRLQLAGAGVAEVEAVISRLEAADANLGRRMEDLLRLQVPKVGEKLREIQVAIAEAKAMIEEYEKLGANVDCSQNVKDECEDAVVRQRANIERLKGLAILLGFKMAMLLRIFDAVKLLQAKKADNVAVARRKMGPHLKLLELRERERALDRRVEGIADFATGGMDRITEAVVPEILQLVQVAAETHQQAVNAANSLMRLGGGEIVSTDVVHVDDLDRERGLVIAELEDGVQDALRLLPAIPSELLGRGAEVADDDLVGVIDGLRERMVEFLPQSGGEGTKVVQKPEALRVADGDLIAVDRNDDAYPQYLRIKDTDPQAKAKRLALFRQRKQEFTEEGLTLIIRGMEVIDVQILSEILGARHLTYTVVSIIFNRLACNNPLESDLLRRCLLSEQVLRGNVLDPTTDVWLQILAKDPALYAELAVIAVNRWGSNAFKTYQFIKSWDQRFSHVFLLFVTHYLTIATTHVNREILADLGILFHDLTAGKDLMSRAFEPGWICKGMEKCSDDFNLGDPKYFEKLNRYDESGKLHLLDRALIAFIENPGVDMDNVLLALNGFFGEKVPEGACSVEKIARYLGFAFASKPWCGAIEAFVRNFADVQGKIIYDLFDDLANNNLLTEAELNLVVPNCSVSGLNYVIYHHPNTGLTTLDLLEKQGVINMGIAERRTQLERDAVKC